MKLLFFTGENFSGGLLGVLDFDIWKAAEEKQSDVYFTKTAQKADKIYYECNRSGNYNPPTSRQRYLKMQGSRKINSRCPSMMRVHLKGNTVQVFYTKTHVGHKIELKHLNVHPTDRKLIAGYISMGLSKQFILEKIRSSWSEENFHRIHLAGPTDLKNISRDFKIDIDVKRDANDLISVESWIKEMQSSDSDPILLYQEQSDADPFILVISTSAQISMFNRYGNNIIAIDSTHGTNDYDFQLTTIMVVDENRQVEHFLWGFPGGSKTIV